MAEEAQSHGGNSGGGGGGGSKLPVIFSALNFLVTIGIGAIVFLQFQKDKKREHLADINPHSEVAGEHAAAGDKAGEHGVAPAAGAAGEKAEAGKPGAKAEKKFGTIIPLDQFTVNLASGSNATPKFVRAALSVEVPDAEVEREFNQKLPQVRNTIIDLFNSKRPTDLQTIEGRNYLKEEIRISLNNFLTNGKVKAVYFTSFSIGG